MRDAAHHRPKDALSPGFKKYAGLLTEYEKRERQPGSAPAAPAVPDDWECGRLLDPEALAVALSNVGTMSPRLRKLYDDAAAVLRARSAAPAVPDGLRDAVHALLHQIDIGDFVDSNGHSAKMLKPVHDLMRLMSESAAPAAPVEPYGHVTTHTVTGQQFFYRWPEPPYLDNAKECIAVYAAPPAQPAPAVPDGWVMVPREPTHEMLYAMAELDGWRKGDRDHPMFTRWRDYWNAALAAAPGSAPAVREPLTEPVACLIRYRNCTPARRAHDGQAHWNDWSEWEVATLAHGKAVTHPSRNPTEDDEWQMKPLYETPAVQPPMEDPDCNCIAPMGKVCNK